MFTLQQISAAHAKVRSGADFPAYILDLSNLGVSAYDTFVTDGHAVYYKDSDHYLASPGNYASLEISANLNPDQFVSDLRRHQQGLTDYPKFCRDCAAAGIEKWQVNLRDMTCTYFDKKGIAVLVEVIPSPDKTDK